jgi:hypothetical protein
MAAGAAGSLNIRRFFTDGAVVIAIMQHHVTDHNI